MTNENRLRAELIARHERSQSAFGAEPPEVIKQVQTFLNSQGWQPALAVDGVTGPKTNAAVTWWQQTHGLTVDGVIGPQTLASMKLGPVPSAGKLQTVNGPAIPGLRQSVVDAFPDFSGKFEGKGLPYMYTDSKGYVTTVTGNLIDPIGAALALPWKHPDGSLASSQEIEDAWNTVKNAWPGVQSTASQSLTNLRLDKSALDSLLFRTLANNNDYLKSQIAGYTNHPADAQMAYHSLAWAWGPGFARVWGQHGQDFLNAVANNDFATAADVVSAASAHEQSINPGIVPRIDATKQLLLNADTAVKKKADFDSLFYPGPVEAATILAAGIGAYIAGGILFIAGLFGYQYYKEHY